MILIVIYVEQHILFQMLKCIFLYRKYGNYLLREIKNL